MSRDKKPSPADMISQKLIDDVRTSIQDSSVQDEKTVDLSKQPQKAISENEKAAARESAREVSMADRPKTGANTFSRSRYDSEATIAVDGFQGRKKNSEVQPQVAVGGPRRSQSGPAMAASSVEAHLLQADNLRMAQTRILDLEKEVDRLRKENDELFNAGQYIKEKSEVWQAQIVKLEAEKREIRDSMHGEITILKGQIEYKEDQVRATKSQNEQLENRLKTDFRKIRVRERELENRLELAVAEKTALVRAKDESILDLKRKLDQVGQEVESYRSKIQDLNRAIEVNQDQFKKTVRALRLALAQLEVKEENIVSTIKKAE